MPTSDGKIGHRDLCTAAVVERTIGPASVSSLKIAASLQSDNFVAGSAGWKIERDTGSAEFQDVIVRGTLNGADLIANTVTTAKLEVTASLVVGQTIESTTYTAGSAGWQIDADGSAEFDNVTVRGTIEASSIEGNVTLGTGGVFRSASSGQRIEITDTDNDLVALFTGDSFEANPGELRTIVSGSGSTRTLQSSLRAPDTTGDSGGMALIVRTESFDDSSFSPAIVASYNGGSSQIPQFRMETDIRLGLVDGTDARPALTFVSDTNTGMYNVAANQIGFSAAGSTRVRIGASFLIVSSGALNDTDPRLDAQGTAANPAFTFRGDTNTGVYSSAANEIGFSTGGAVRITISNTQIKATGSVHFVDTAPGASGTIDAQWINSGGAVRTLSETSSMLSKKQDVTPLEEFLDTSKVLNLDLIAFHMKEDPDGPMHIGTVAASVGKHLPTLAYKRDGKWDFGSYSRLVIPLIAEVRKLRDRVDILEAA